MAQYVPQPSNFKSGMVGTLYNIGISDGVNSYGYTFKNDGPGGTNFKESTDITDKQKLIQYSSPNLIDRDLVYFPRVTQGDFSGGQVQVVFIDPAKHFDSDLEIRSPGYLNLRAGWNRTALTSISSGVAQTVAGFNNNVYTTFGTTLYDIRGNTITTGITSKFVDTDGLNLYVGDGVNTIASSTNASAWSNLLTNAGSFTQMWFINQGTNGRFIYLARQVSSVGAGTHNLFKVDVNNAGAGAVQVPTSSQAISIVDITPFQNGIAILTKDAQAGNSEVWYHDGANMTRIIRLINYVPAGIVNCLGTLYVTATSFGQFEAPVLIKIDAGAYQVVVRPAAPLSLLTSAAIGAPVASGQYVYFALTTPQINYVTKTSYIGVWDSSQGVYSHLGNLDTADNPQTTGPRQLACIGRAAFFPMISGGTGSMQFQSNQGIVAGSFAYVSSGQLVSSKLDFSTPGIAKRFRRIECIHAPLQAGESIGVQAFIDGDQFHFGQTPSVSTTNNTIGATTTALTLGQNSVGKLLYFVLTLGGPQTTTPDVNRVSVEVGGTWSWEFDLNCTNTRRTLNQQMEDQQGVNGKDLTFLLRNAYENGSLLTLFLANAVSYTVTIESMEIRAPTYEDHLQSTVRADQEFYVHIVLKQVL